MSLEQKINYQLNKYPGVKKVVKSVYQHAMYAISPKIKSEGNIIRISPNDPSHEYFFGYYDKSPWDATDRYMLCMRAKDTWSDVSPKEKADIILVDTSLPENDKERIRKIAETSSWNVQQSCMLQWLGPDFSSRILFNDYRDGKYVAVIKEIESGAEKIIPAPVYSVSADGKIALTLDFSRLYNLRPGYGYYNIPEKTKGVGLPDAVAVWKIDLESGAVTDLLTYKDVATFQPRPEMQEAGSVHKVNHLMLSPNGQRFMVLYRWFIGERKYTRLITCNVDETDMYVLSDDDMVSHCFWKDDEHILAFENKRDGGTGYYLMRDKTQEYKRCWPELTGDGHPSYSLDRSHIVTDSYPDRARIQYLRVMKDENSKPETVAKVFSPFKYDNDTRCDLHPRWNHAGDKVCFDSVFEGHRGLYITDTLTNENGSISMKNRVKSAVRNCAIGAYKSIIKDGKTQKRISVAMYNLKAIPEARKRTPEDPFDYKGIINGPTTFHLNEYYRGNCYYGIADTLRSYCGYHSPINACIEHGVYFGDYIDYSELENSGLNGVITFSKNRKEIIRKVSECEVFPIGSYIKYANPLISEEALLEKKREFGKSLLVFPDHSIDRVETQFDTDGLINWINEVKNTHAVKTVVISLFWKDVLLGRDKEYLDQGYKVVCAGYRLDPLFLRRLRTFIEIADLTASNATGTHVGYCISLNKPHCIYNQDIQYNAYTETDKVSVPESYSETVIDDRTIIANAFKDFTETITDNQYKICNKYWGLDCFKTPEELRTILLSIEK